MLLSCKWFYEKTNLWFTCVYQCCIFDLTFWKQMERKILLSELEAMYRCMGGGRKWVMPCVSMLMCVWVPVCYMKSVSQREKINEISVTGTSPSTFAHVHTLIPTTDRSPCAAYMHNMCTFLHMAQPHAAQSRILMWSLRALLSAGVTFNPSKKTISKHISNRVKAVQH